MSNGTVYELLEEVARRYSNRDAIVFPNRRWTYQRLASETERMAGGLAALDVGPGDHVGALLPNSPEMVALMFATTRLGAVWVPMSIRYRPDELAYVLEHSNVKVLVVTDQIEEHVPLLRNLTEAGLAWDAQGACRSEGYPSLERVVCMSDEDRDDILTLDALLAGAPEAPPPARPSVREMFTILYTSGTTARPKGVMLNHNAFARGMALVTDALSLNDGESVYGPLPLFHMAVYNSLMPALIVGGAFVTMAHFDAELGASLIERERCTSGWPAFENVIGPLLEEPVVSRYDLSSLAVCSVIGPPALQRRLSEALPGCAFVQPYGSTEMGGVICMTSPEDDIETRLATAGLPLPGVEIRVVDPDGKSLPDGEIGELCARSEQVSLGYYRDPEQTAQAFDSEGWYHGGDLGYINARGEIVYTGRLKELIKVGGENLAATELEDFLLGHPAVQAAQVVGVPDRKYMEVPAAFIELRVGFDVDESGVREYCAERLARFKVPRYVRFVREWPMSATKVHKPTLREQLIAELGLDTA